MSIFKQGCQKTGPFIINDGSQSYTFSYKKGAYSIPGSTEKMGLFGTHICTMSYIGIYPPPPPRVMGQSTLVLDMGLTKFAEMMILLENVRLRPSTYV